MPYTDRPGKRQRPFNGSPNALTFPVSDESGIVIYAQPGAVLFIEAMWHGDYQQVPVDPDEAEDLIEAIQQAMEYLAEQRRKETR